MLRLCYYGIYCECYCNIITVDLIITHVYILHVGSTDYYPYWVLYPTKDCIITQDGLLMVCIITADCSVTIAASCSWA